MKLAVLMLITVLAGLGVKSEPAQMSREVDSDLFNVAHLMMGEAGYRNTKSARSEKKRLQALAETKNLENWFMNDPYCVLSDPNRVIAGIKDRSKRKGNFHFEFTQRGISK